MWNSQQSRQQILLYCAATEYKCLIKLQKQNKGTHIKLCTDQFRLFTQYWPNSVEIPVSQLGK